MNDLKQILSKINFTLLYGGFPTSIEIIKSELSKLDTDTKLFILSEYPSSIQFMCENQPEEFLLEVIEFFPDLFKYFAKNSSEKVCIKAIEKNVNNYNYIEKPSLLLHSLYIDKISQSK